MPSRTTSLAVSHSHTAQSSTATSAVPALSIGSPTRTSSSSSVNTELASLLGGMQLLEEGDEGVLEVPQTQRPRYSHQCIFHFLECSESFDLFEEWRVHVLSHFRTHAPPIEAQCPLCPQSFTHAARDRAWNMMLAHVSFEHFRLGHNLATSRPDFALFKFLYNRRILTEPQFKALYMTRTEGTYNLHSAPSSGTGSSNEPFVSVSNERRHRRVQDRGRPADARAPRGSSRPRRP